MNKLNLILISFIMISLIFLAGCATKEQTTQECKDKCYETAKQDFNASNISASHMKIAYDKFNACIKNC